MRIATHRRTPIVVLSELFVPRFSDLSSAFPWAVRIRIIFKGFFCHDHISLILVVL